MTAVKKKKAQFKILIPTQLTFQKRLGFHNDNRGKMNHELSNNFPLRASYTIKKYIS